MKKNYVLPVLLFFTLQATILSAQGIIVDGVDKGSVAEKAGIRPGETLLSWERAANPPSNPGVKKGLLRSTFDLWFIQKEEAPRGLVMLKGASGEYAMTQGDWGIKTKPRLKAQPAILCYEGDALAFEKKYAEAFSSWKKAALLCAGDDGAACWIYLKIGKAYIDFKKYDKAEEAFEAARTEAERSGDKSIDAQMLSMLADLFKKKGDLEKSDEYYNLLIKLMASEYGENLVSAFAYNNIGANAMRVGDVARARENFEKANLIRGKQAPESYEEAMGLTNLAVVSYDSGDLKKAQEYHERSFAIMEKLFPGSLQVAFGLNNLGVVADEIGQVAKAEEYYKGALELFYLLDPEGGGTADCYNNLGIVSEERGDLKAAEEYFGKAWAIHAKMEPESLPATKCLNNMGLVAELRGNLEKAELCLKKVLEIRQKLLPDGPFSAAAYNNLGLLEKARGDLQAAEESFSRAMAVYQKLSPDSLDVAMCLVNLGTVAVDRDDFAKAEEYHRKALGIMEKIVPDSLQVAAALDSLGGALSGQGKTREALALHERALELNKRVASESVAVASSINNVASAAEMSGDNARAEELYRKAIDMFSRLSPGSYKEAESNHNLGVLYRKTGRQAEAYQCFQKAVDSLESQKGMLGGRREDKEKFSAKYADFYRDLAGSEIDLKYWEKALGTIEKFRARNLIEMLAERDIGFNGDAPHELIRERNELLAEYGRKREEVDGLSPEKDAEKLAALRKELEALVKNLGEVKEKIIKASSRLASLQYPEPLGAGEARTILGGGTLLLSYCAGENKTGLVAMLGDELLAFSVPLDRETLRKEVIDLRRMLGDPKSSAKAIDKRKARLYEEIIKPAGRLVTKSDRVVVCADGPLHYLPFSLLIEDKPVVNAISVTVMKELQGRPSPKGDALVAFGNPAYAEVNAESGDSRSLPGGQPTPIPASQAEIDTLAALYGGQARLFAGAQATEEKAMTAGKDAAVIHFACHGFLDENFPLDSGLALAGTDVLQAWEIFEGLRIDSDLVTLSACESGLGKDMGGEGLVGLTRAFQYAGAKTVLSSLWSVSDESTATLMQNFYSHLKEGKSKAESLRLAREEMRKSKYAHPFYWAGFVLNGDWK